MKSNVKSDAMKESAIVERVIILFRECQNLIPSIENQIHALGNVTRQNKALQDAVRRKRFLDDAGQCSLFSLSSLGVLSFFPSSTLEQLIGQHTVDEGALLASCFTAKQKWSDRVQKMKSCLEQLEEKCVCSNPTANAELYWVSEEVPAQGHCDRFQSLVYGLHGLVAAAADMEVTLQEMVLAIRKDYQRILTGDQSFADSLSYFMAHECSDELGPMICLLHPQHDLNGSTNPLTTAFPMLRGGHPQLTYIEAMDKLESFVSTRWENCRSRFLNAESLLLLA